MTLYLFANDAVTTLAGPIASNSTTCNLAAGTGALFPSPTAGQQFAITFIKAGDASGLTLNEIAYCTARSGDTLTITRGQEGSTAKAWSAGDSVENLWTAGSATSMVQKDELQRQPGNYGGVSLGSSNAQTITLSPVPASLSLIIGSPIRFRAGLTNTAAMTLTINGVGTATVINPDGTNLGLAQIGVGGVYEVIYSGTAFILMGNPYALLSRSNAWTGLNTFSAATTFAADANFNTNAVVAGDVNVSGAVAVFGAITSGSSIVATSGVSVTAGNVSATGGRLRAQFGAANSGDQNAGVILADYTQNWPAINRGYATFPNGFAIQLTDAVVAIGLDRVTTQVNLARTFTGGLLGATICFVGNLPPIPGQGGVSVQPNSNSSVLVTTGVGVVGTTGVVITTYGFNLA